MANTANRAHAAIRGHRRPVTSTAPASLVGPATPVASAHHTAAIAVALFIAATLAGCAVGPNYKKPETPVAPTYGAAEPAIYTSEQAQVQFWKQFGDGTLDKLGRRLPQRQPRPAHRSRPSRRSTRSPTPVPVRPGANSNRLRRPHHAEVSAEADRIPVHGVLLRRGFRCDLGTRPVWPCTA